MDSLTIGSFAAFLGALAQLFDPIRRLTGIAGTTQRMLAAAESVFTLSDFESEPTVSKQRFIEPVRGRIEYDNITHSFEGSDTAVIKRLSFTVESGQSGALVGRAGSGKTTRANMLPRFVIPSSGEIRIDGVHIQDVDLLSLR